MGEHKPRVLRVSDGFSMALPKVMHWDYQAQAKREGAVVDFTDALPGCPTCGAYAYISFTHDGGWVRYDCEHNPAYEEDD